MAQQMPKLVRIERRESDLHLTYEDEQELTVLYHDLRHACPCAHCSPLRNEDETSLKLRSQVESFKLHKPSINPVGHYALNFIWENGCSNGIFRFERIWDLANRRDPDHGKPYVHGAW